MSERKISEKSLENLRKSNQESNFLTREAIETALLQLLEKKDLAKISISELVKRAGVSRAAFYRNYDSKEEILESVFKRSVHNIMEQLSHYDVKTDLYLVWVHLFRAAKKEAKVIQLALDYHLEKIFVQAMQEFLEKYHGKSKGVSSYLHSRTEGRPADNIGSFSWNLHAILDPFEQNRYDGRTPKGMKVAADTS